MNLIRQFACALVSLATLAVAPLPASAAEPPPIEAYGELPSLEMMVLSPKGTRIAAVTTINGNRMVMVFDDAMNVLKRTSVDDIKVRSLEFIDEENLLLQRSTTENLGHDFLQSQYESYQAIVIPVSGQRKPWLVFANRPSVISAVFGFHGIRWVGGRPKGIFEGIELRQSVNRTEYVFDHGRPALFQVDMLDGQTRRIDNSAAENSYRDWLIGADGEPVVRFDISEENGSWSIKNAKGTRIASGTNANGGAGLRMIGKDGTTVIYSTEDSATGFSSMFEVPINGSGQPVEIFAEIGISRFYIDRTNGRLMGYLPDEGDGQPVFYEKGRQDSARNVFRAFKSFNTWIADWSDDFGQMLVNTSGNGDSGTYYLVDLAAMRAEGVGLERPSIKAEQVGPISTVAYKAQDGLDLDGILTLPPGIEAKNLPLIMLPHGGPHSHDEAAFDWWAQAFASRGYAVFQPNFRGSTNRDEPFIRAGYGEWGKKMQTDISDAITALAEKGVVDPKRACIVGASYGGYAALAGVTLQQGLYRCAVAVAPVSDLNLHFLTNVRESGQSRMVRRSLEEEFGGRKDLGEVSPRQRAASADAPILLIHGRDDTVVPFRQSKIMADALKDARKEYKLVELDGEDHWLSGSATRKRMLVETLAFVQKYNPAD